MLILQFELDHKAYETMSISEVLIFYALHTFLLSHSLVHSLTR